jgi:hypothetical protein
MKQGRNSWWWTKKFGKKANRQKNVKVKNDDFIGIYADKWFGEVEVYEGQTTMVQIKSFP